jgi:dTDP-glucose 4,6-dehydratase
MSILATGAAGFIGSNFVLNWLEINKEKVIQCIKKWMKY